MSTFAIDAFEFCRLRERSEGVVAVADLPRLAEESLGKSGEMQWSLQGGSNREGHPQLKLSISGSVRLVCQRCLAPFDFGIASEAALVLAQDEESADEIDALLADEPVEVIVGSRKFDILQLIEDEALLTIPLSPRHDVCPNASLLVAKEEEAESPFSVLKNLKQ